MGKITKLNIDSMNTALRVPYRHHEPVQAFLASKTEIFADFTKAGQAYSNAATMELAIFKPSFERCFETQVGLAKQTPAALNLAFIHFVENVLLMSLSSAGFGASVTSTPLAGYVALADVQDMIQQAVAAHEARKPGASKAGAAQPTNRKSGTPSRIG